MEKEDLIYKAAVMVISQHGYDNTKIQMIAEEARIAVGTVYLYFQSKEKILEYIICRGHQKRIDYLDQLILSDKPAFEKIGDFLQFHLDTLIKDDGEGKILVQEVSLSSVMENENLRNIVNKLQERIGRIIKEAQEQGSVRKSDTQLLIITLMNFVKGFTSSLLQETNNKEDLPELKTQAINFMLNGIKSR